MFYNVNLLYMNLNTLKWQVEYILQNKKETRDSDIDLMRQVRKKFYREHITLWYVSINNLYCIPQMDVISMIRRKFNQTGLYISDKEEVRKSRRQNTEKYLQFLWYR